MDESYYINELSKLNNVLAVEAKNKEQMEKRVEEYVLKLKYDTAKKSEAIYNKALETQAKNELRLKELTDKKKLTLQEKQEKKRLEKLKQAYEDDFKLYQDYEKRKEELENSKLKDWGKAGNFALKLQQYSNEYGGAGGAIKGITTDLINGLADTAKQVFNKANEIAKYQSAMDTRLYGSGLQQKQGSYFRQFSSDITGLAGVSPLVTQSSIMSNLSSMIGKGIAFNVEQRATLESLKEKIATTFNATDGALVKLVRIQQADTTAARLGMEAALNQFLNSMYSTTEYMTDAAASIRSSLYEASALKGATEATAFEYQVQK